MVSIKKSYSLTKKYVLIISFSILFLSFKSSNQWSSLPIGNEFIEWCVIFVFICLLLKIKNIFTSPLIETNLFYVKIYLFWNVICMIRGVFTADNYWEFKNLIQSSFLLLLPLIVYLSNSFKSIQIIFQTWLKYGLIIFIFFSPFLYGDGVGKFLMPISYILLFFPVLNKKWKIIVLLFTTYVFVADITARSNLIKFLAPLLIGLSFYFKNYLNVKIINYARMILLLSPIIFFFFGAIGIFNVFKLDEYFGERNVNIKSYSGEKVEESLTADTRTFLYIEVIESAIKNNYVLLGRTPARGNDSVSFGDFNKEILKTGKLERFSNEVSILNIFTWLGIIGVVLYFLIFFRSSYLAINQSNNIFIKLVGLNISFRWAFGFVEDFSTFDLSNIFLWIMIGMCFSETFRKMSNNEMKDWVQGIFESLKGFRSINTTQQLKLK